MQRNKYLPGFPLPAGFVKRSRLHELLAQSTENTVTTIIAGPGYGKTTLVSSYVQKSKAKVIWLNFSPLDNQTDFFWRSLANATMKEIPEIGEIILNREFPKSLQELSEFFTVLEDDEKVRESVGKIILVFDNFEMIKNQQVLDFLHNIQSVNQVYSSARVQKIIISNEQITNLSTHPIHLQYDSSHKYRSIRAAELAFTADEVQQLFRLYGIELKEEKLHKVMDDTAGWPLVVSAFAAAAKSQSEEYERVLQNIYDMLQANYFSNYPKFIRDMLIKLSGFQTFNLEIISRLLPPEMVSEPTEIMQLLFQNPFIEYTVSKRRLRFIKPYQRFLIAKFLTLGEEEQKETLIILGEYLFENTDMHSVIELYIKSNNYEGITRCLKMLSPYNLGLPYTKRIIRYLRRLPQGFREKNPWIKFFIGQEYFKCSCITQSEMIFNELIEKLEKDEEENVSILGECYFMKAIISLRKEEFFDLQLLKKAVSLLPNGSILTNQHSFLTNENGVFFLPANERKTVAEMVTFIYQYISLFSKISNGCLAGFDYLFEAEASLAACQFERAEFCANQAVFRAALEGQHDIVMSAYNVLVNLAFYQGDIEVLCECLQNFDDYCEKNDTSQFNDLRDVFYAIYSFYLGRPEEAADWIKEADLHRHYEGKAPFAGRELFICAVAAYHQEKYPLFSLLTDELDDLIASNNIWKMKVSGNMLHALSFLRQEQPERAISAFKEAYEMIYSENLFYPVLTFGEHILPLLKLVRESTLEEIDVEWLDKLEELTREHVKKLRALRIDYGKMEQKPAFTAARLTLREKRVLKLLAQGFSRSEIALNLGISVSGVQKFLGKIYIKLGAKNGTDAVSIAHNNNII